MSIPNVLFHLSLNICVSSRLNAFSITCPIAIRYAYHSQYYTNDILHVILARPISNFQLEWNLLIVIMVNVISYFLCFTLLLK
jgi:hypothetical protein